MKQLLFLFLGVILSASPSSGQNTHYYGVFPTIDHSGTISKKLDYSLYYFAGLNLFNEEVNGVRPPADFFVFYAEHALSYKANPHLSFTASYVYERQHPTESNYRNENRFYLQSTYKYDLGKVSLKHRLRYDGRYIQDRLTGETPYTSRLRYLFGISAPLQKTSGNLYFSAYNEFFFNTFKNAPALYAENWAFAGVGYKTKKAGSFEVGPLYIFWVNNQSNLTNFYYLQLCWVTHVNFTKKETK